jgi:hypothetical protein
MNEDLSEFRPPSYYAMESKIRSVEMTGPDDLEAYHAITYEGETSNGMCGSVIVTNTRNPVIIGIHTAGYRKTGSKSYGIGAILTQKSVLETRSEDIVKTCETTAFSQKALGKEFGMSTSVHPRNPIHFMPEDTEFNCEAYGQHDVPLASFKSNVGETPIAEKVLEKYPLETQFGPPPKSAVRPSRRRHLMNVTEVMHPANPRFVKLASDDLSAKINMSLFGEDCTFKEYVHPLSMDDAINGVPGVRGFDCINPKTSIGFPLNKPKYHFLERDAMDEEIGLKTYKFQKCEVVDGKKTIFMGTRI